MRVQAEGSTVRVWLSAGDTEKWATRPGASWPCSVLRGRAVFAEFDRNGLCDLTVNGRTGIDVPAEEFDACLADHLSNRVPLNHPATIPRNIQDCLRD